jgi:hypothetical protein
VATYFQRAAAASESDHGVVNKVFKCKTGCNTTTYSNRSGLNKHLYTKHTPAELLQVGIRMDRDAATSGDYDVKRGYRQQMKDIHKLDKDYHKLEDQRRLSDLDSFRKILMRLKISKMPLQSISKLKITCKPAINIIRCIQKSK